MAGRTAGQWPGRKRMKTEATPDDWQWFSATGRTYRAREANADEWSRADREFVADHPYLTAVLRRSDGVGVVVAHSCNPGLRLDTDAELHRRLGPVFMMVTTTIDLAALKAELETDNGMA